MTAFAAWPGSNAWADLYARFAAHIAAGDLAQAHEPLAADLARYIEAAGVAMGGGAGIEASAGRTMKAAWAPALALAETQYQQWARSDAARQWMATQTHAWMTAAVSLPADDPSSDVARRAALNAYGLPAQATERELLAQDGSARLYRYGTGRRPRSVPILLVYALVNRPSIVDLDPDCSLIGGLLRAGRDVYLIDWGDPVAADHDRSLTDYVLTVDRLIGHISAKRGVDLLGICQGGVLSLLYAAIQPKKVRKLVTMVTPVDFHTTEDLLSHWAQAVPTTVMAESRRGVPAVMLDALFQGLAPYRLGVGKYLDLLDHANDPAWIERFRRMEYWIHGGPDHPAQLFADFLTHFYQGNGFVTKTVRVADQVIDLKTLALPILNIYGRDDHIVPPAAARALGELVGSRRYTEIELPTGHIGAFVSRKSRDLPTQIAAWLSHR